MGLPEVKKFFEEKNIQNEIILLNESSATVDLAAKALGREPGEIAKSLAFKLKDDSCIIIVVMGTARIDNHKYKETFGCKAAMLSFDETLARTGHPVGGVCPFGVPADVQVYLDESLKQYKEVLPAAGTPNSAVLFKVEDLGNAVGNHWVNVCKDPE